MAARQIGLARRNLGEERRKVILLQRFSPREQHMGNRVKHRGSHSLPPDSTNHPSAQKEVSRYTPRSITQRKIIRRSEHGLLRFSHRKERSTGHKIDHRHTLGSRRKKNAPPRSAKSCEREHDLANVPARMLYRSDGHPVMAAVLAIL